LRPIQFSLAKMGASHDSILVDDLALLDTRPYKLIVLLNTYPLTDAQRELIRSKLLRDGKTLLWCYAPGLFNGSRTSVEAMHALTGLRIVAGRSDRRYATQIELQQSGHPLGQALIRAGLSVLGPRGAVCQLVSVDDPQAVVLGTHPMAGSPTLALKSGKDWHSVYSISAALPAAFYRELARWAGVHLYNDRDDTLYACRSYLTISADQAGRRTLRLPRRSDVIDPFTGRRLHAGVREFAQDFAAKETQIYCLHPID
jgi:hypothetical protein